MSSHYFKISSGTYEFGCNTCSAPNSSLIEAALTAAESDSTHTATLASIEELMANSNEGYKSLFLDNLNGVPNGGPYTLSSAGFKVDSPSNMAVAQGGYTTWVPSTYYHSGSAGATHRSWYLLDPSTGITCEYNGVDPFVSESVPKEIGIWMGARLAIVKMSVTTTYTVTINGSGSGSINSNPAGSWANITAASPSGTNWSAQPSVFNSGTTVTFTATPAAGFTFFHWVTVSGNVTNNALTISNLSQNEVIEAVFTAGSTSTPTPTPTPTPPSAPHTHDDVAAHSHAATVTAGIRSDIGRHISDLPVKESLHADDLFLISSTDVNGALINNSIDFNDIFTSFTVDAGQEKNGILIGAFLTQNYPQIIGGAKTFTDEDFLKIQHQGATIGSLISGQTFNIHEYIVAAAPSDNMGDHTATEDLNMGAFCVVKSGSGSEGLKIGSDGSVSVGFDHELTWDPSTEYPFTVKGNKSGTGDGKNYLVGFIQTGAGKNVVRCDAPAANESHHFIDGYLNNSVKKFHITTGGSASFMGSLKNAGAVQFAGGKFTITEAGVLNAVSCTSSFGPTTMTAATTFKGSTNFTSTAPVTFGSTTAFNKPSTFNELTTFTKTTNFTGGASFNSTAVFNKSTSFKKDVTFHNSPTFNKNITLAPGVKILDSSGNTASGSTPGSGLAKTTAGVMSVKFGAGGTNVGAGHCGIEFDSSGGLQISSKESTAVQGHFHGIVSHPQPGSVSDIEGGQLSLYHGSDASAGAFHAFSMIDSFVDKGNLYHGVHRHSVDNKLFPLVRIGHASNTGALHGLAIGVSLCTFSNMHVRNADGNGHACWYAGTGKQGTKNRIGGDSCGANHVFRTHKPDETELEVLTMYTNGNISAAGSFSGGTLAQTSSDIRLKKNIESIEADNALGIVSQLRPVIFDWKASDEKSAGFIAQEVEKILPDAVKDPKDNEFSPDDPEFAESGGIRGVDGFKRLQYEAIIPYLCGAIQEQQKQIEELKKEIEELKNS